MESDISAAIREMFEEEIKPEAKKLVPVRTGETQRSIDYEMAETEKGPLVAFFTDSGHGGYVETGTRKMRSQPFLSPAFQQGFKSLAGRLQAKIKAGRG